MPRPSSVRTPPHTATVVAAIVALALTLGACAPAARTTSEPQPFGGVGIALAPAGGALLVAVDGADVRSAAPADIVARVRGPVGTPVALTFEDEAGERRTVTLVRATIVPPSEEGATASDGAGG